MAVLNRHNQLRSIHGVPLLHWDEKLVEEAQHLTGLAQTNKCTLPPAKPEDAWGRNVAWWPSLTPQSTCLNAVDRW